MATEHGSSDQGGWEFADAWIMAAIGDGVRRDHLRALLAAADYYNHAIPTEAEVRQGFGRLRASGLITSSGDMWVPTPLGKALGDGIADAGFDRVGALLDAMASVPLTEGTWDVPPGALDRAYRRYMHPLTWMLPSRRKRGSTGGRR